jgi:hypothetical protein
MYSFESIVARFMAAGGILEVTMVELRDAVGAAKLGSLVRDEIGRGLKARRVRWVPRRLPNDQTHVVILWLPDSEAGALWDRALDIAEWERANRPADPNSPYDPRWAA